jgi:hypothetical protein
LGFSSCFLVFLSVKSTKSALYWNKYIITTYTV